MQLQSAVDGVVARGYQHPGTRFGSQIALDLASWLLALLLATLLRFEATTPSTVWLPLAVVIAASWILQCTVGFAFRLYRGRYSYGSFEEVRALAGAILLIGVVLAVPAIAFGPMIGLPRSIVPIAVPFALLFTFSARYLKRLYVESRMRLGDDSRPTLIYGAGFLGGYLVRRMASDPDSGFAPVGLLDDDRRKHNARVRSVRVLGSLDDLPAVAERTQAAALIVAIARADADLMRRVHDIATECGIDVKVLPTLTEIMEGKNRPSDMRDLSIEDIIGRHPVDMRESLVTEYLTDKRVLVTGAGGSIGSELCRQIAGFLPAELIMLDRDETGLQTAQLATAGHGLLNTRDVVLADIRDEASLEQVFAEHRPHVVFHAAALKHLPMLEQYPEEAWKTNVLGTRNVLRAAEDVGVETFINISTDKAANPTSVLGHSKRVAEKLTAWMGARTGANYLSVRFGNVLGSRGSMIPTFTALIDAGGPITVTHPDATRYFMTIAEACQLVVQAGGIGGPGEVLILDMGEPVRILDVAERMIAMSGKDIGIIFTGLREGEKLHEELVGARESAVRRLHPKIAHARGDVIAPEQLDLEGWLARMQSDPRENDTEITRRAAR